RGASRSSARYLYVIRTGDWAGQTCGTVGHTQSRCFSYLSDTQRAEFGDTVELPRWQELLRQGVDIFALDYDAILTAIYALTIGAEGDCFLCVLPDPGIEAAALGASEFALPGTTPTEALHTFTLDAGASRCFFRNSTTLTPLFAPVPVRLADPSGGPVLARSSTILLCPAVPSSSMSGLHLPSFYTNLVSTAALQDTMVTTTTPRASSDSCVYPGVRVRSGSTPLLVSPAVAPDSTVAPPPWSPLPATPSWHALSPPCFWSSQVSASLTALACPPCLPCVEGRQRAAPNSSFPPTIAPLQTLHMDVWGPARVSGQGCERYFLLVVDDYTRYTTVFPLRSKGEVPDVLIPWIRAVRLQLRERFREDLPDLRLHSDRGAPHWLSHGGRSYLHDPCGCSPFSMVVCGLVCCASTQPLAPCLLAGDLAYTALDGRGLLRVRSHGSREMATAGEVARQPGEGCCG
ncbi:unnamed protein product, partial [Closterium sp. NIES-53]